MENKTIWIPFFMLHTFLKFIAYSRLNFLYSQSFLRPQIFKKQWPNRIFFWPNRTVTQWLSTGNWRKLFS
jgi:hypothetical protein